MQRKNSILKSSTPKSKSGMAMIMAIAVIVIIATIMAISLSLTSQTTKRTTDIYLYEQAILVSKSAAELALLDIAQYGPCATGATAGTSYLGSYKFDLDGDGSIAGEIYDVNTTLKYVYKGLPSCTSDNNYTNIITDEQNGSVLMDITVSVDDPTVTTEPIRYFRRSIQKL